jgi:predicted NBD/HSP70 family sugar kinase
MGEGNMEGANGRNIVVIDVGGTNLKVLVPGQKEPVKIPSGAAMTPSLMVSEVKKAVGATKYTGVSMGYPGPVINGKPALEPHNLAPGWVGFAYSKAFPCPVKIVNDAAMQALGSYEGGRMLFLGLGTGLGSALIVDGVLAPMELAHLPYKKGRTFEDHVGLRGMERMGKKKWRNDVMDVVARLKAALVVDYVVLGGGNAKYLKELPRDVRMGANANAFLGGVRLWKRETPAV